VKKNVNKLLIGSWITIGHPSIAEILADAGFDWLCIDIEHSVIDYTNVQQLIMAIQGKKKLAYVRVGENNSRIIKRVLDAGADGIIVPMVNNMAEAQKAVDAVFYPPVGKRGVGLARAQGYGFRFEEYLEKQKDIEIIVQIEHIDAISNLEEILSVSGVAGSIIGPYDLSASLGSPGNYELLEVKQALEKYEEISIRMGKPMGFHIVQPDPKLFAEFRLKGYTILAFGFDAMFLGSICRNQMDIIRQDSK
jgi:2-dehydro-3-deoxyglucarate aldolase